MRTLVLDMPSGIAGDMLLAALAACGADLDAVAAGLDGLGIGPFAIRGDAVEVGHVRALRVYVDAPQEARWRPVAQTPAAAEHAHRPYRAIRDLIAGSALPERVRTRAARVFRVLAEAEGAVHGVDPDAVEFHEVGSRDAIADVVGCCLALEHLGIERVCAGTVNPGRGVVRCAHGLMPVPVPAVAELLRASRWPVRIPAEDTGELTTPTGMALLVGLGEPGAQPGPGRVIAHGFGAGHRAIPGMVNACRASLVDADPAAPAAADESLLEVSAQLDDATGEDLGGLCDALIAAGARDALLLPALMKKGRPGHLLHVLVDPARRAALVDLILTRTPAIGVRWHAVDRRILPRRRAEVVIDGQRIALKIVTLPDGRERAKPEHDDLRAAASALGRSPVDLAAAALAAYAAHG